uniref:Thioredoxin domain-containing protein n=1 Tax=viral metagenome TaxID=1070528 RepID=A0A6C0L188_9ZZZZ|tara:strand:- start:2480 stop:4468 length:1989 start_codon:yes stop_codon:yes gene_type:complete
MSSISTDIDIKMVEGIDYVRPPSLDFKEIKNNKDFIEYEITTGYQSDKRMGQNSFINYIKSFIFCNDTLTIQVPKKSFMIRNGKKRFAYAVGMFPNPKNKKAAYLDGCILAALGLKKQKTNADIICFITHDITAEDKRKLEVVFDKVMYVPYISPFDMGGEGDLKTIQMDPKIFQNCPNYTKDHPYAHVFFKLHIFNPDLFPYEKVCFVDSDLVPLNYYDSLFMLDCPAGFVEYRKKIPYLEGFHWDRCDFLEHGKPIPKELTDIDKKTGADVNAGLLLVEPNKKEYNAMIKELTSPLKEWMGKNKTHKGFYHFNFDKTDGREFVKDSYCYPEQNYLTKRYSGKWNYIEFAFQSWSRDPCNSFGIHMAAFNPKPWFKQPAGTKIKMNKIEPYLDYEGGRIPLAIDESNHKNYENISYSYEIFNEVILWGLLNYPELKNFFINDTKIYGKKISFDKDKFDDLSKDHKFLTLKNITKDVPEYRKLSLTQKYITNIINDYDKEHSKIKNKNIQICKKKTKGLSKKQFNLQIIEPIDESLLDGGAKQKKKKRKPKKKKRTIQLKKKRKTKKKQNKKPTFYYFSMNGCHHCNTFDETWNKLINKYNQLMFMKKVTTDDNPQLIQKYNVSSYPTLKLLKVNCKKPIDFNYNREKIHSFDTFLKENKVL